MTRVFARHWRMFLLGTALSASGGCVDALDPISRDETPLPHVPAFRTLLGREASVAPDAVNTDVALSIGDGGGGVTITNADGSPNMSATSLIEVKALISRASTPPPEDAPGLPAHYTFNFGMWALYVAVSAELSFKGSIVDHISGGSLGGRNGSASGPSIPVGCFSPLMCTIAPVVETLSESTSISAVCSMALSAINEAQGSASLLLPPGIAAWTGFKWGVSSSGETKVVKYPNCNTDPADGNNTNPTEGGGMEPANDGGLVIGYTTVLTIEHCTAYDVRNSQGNYLYSYVDQSTCWTEVR